MRLGLGYPGGQEEQAERVPELPAHHAVQYEVDGGVDQRQHVHHLAHVLIAIREEPLAQEQREQAEYALRELRDQEQHEHGQQHSGGPVRLAFLLGRLATGAGQLGPAPFGLEQRANQSQAEHGQRHARYDLDHHAVHPEIDVGQIRGRGQVADVHVVQRDVTQLLRTAAGDDSVARVAVGTVDMPRRQQRYRSVTLRVQRLLPGEQLKRQITRYAEHRTHHVAQRDRRQSGLHPTPYPVQLRMYYGHVPAKIRIQTKKPTI